MYFLPESRKYMIHPHEDHCIITFDWLIGQPIKFMWPVYKLQCDTDSVISFCVNMGSPVALIVLACNDDLEILEDFAGRNEMEVVRTEVDGHLGLGYFIEGDMLDSLSLLGHLGVACALYKIALPSVPFPPCPSPTSSVSGSSSPEEDELSSDEYESTLVGDSGSV